LLVALDPVLDEPADGVPVAVMSVVLGWAVGWA
jgi:hypothetical protein